MSMLPTFVIANKPTRLKVLSCGLEPTKYSDSEMNNIPHVIMALSLSQPVCYLFAADEGTNTETAGRTAIENI